MDSPRDAETTKKPDEIHRYILFPIQLPKVWKSYKVVESGFWTAEDVLNTPARADSQLDEDAAITLAELVAAVRNARLPEKLAPIFHSSEVSCYLGFQAMQENIHVEAATAAVAFAVDRATDAREINPLKWPQIESAYAPGCGGLLRLVEHTAVYASAAAAMQDVRTTCANDPVLGDLADRVLRDYDRSYRFGLTLLVLTGVGTPANEGPFLEVARGVADLVTEACEEAHQHELRAEPIAIAGKEKPEEFSVEAEF
ncbi:hypothetical protein AURDEDRAFT_170879 [Auricularia subglabra TFB-10046 SS5]|nr:hypothetical protein AURDEDRAFT_170879 [Auricularia subglabra TFB-10046 SS5]